MGFFIFSDQGIQVSGPTIAAEMHTVAFQFSSQIGHYPFLLNNENEPLKLDELLSFNSPDEFLFVFPNSSSIENRLGWPMRNFLAAIASLRSVFLAQLVLIRPLKFYIIF
jgi:hypothetical protein